MPNRLTDEQLTEIADGTIGYADSVVRKEMVPELLELREEIKRLRSEILGVCDWYDCNSCNDHEVAAALDKMREATQCPTD